MIGRENIMKQNASIVLKGIFTVLMVNILSLILLFSLTTLAVGMTTETIGYVAYSVDEDGKIEELYTHYYKDGDDQKLKEYEDKGVKVQTQTFRSTVTDTTSNILDTVAGLLSFILLFAFVYNMFWTRGDKDANLATFGHTVLDKYRGIKLGLLIELPFAMSYLLLLADKIFGLFSSSLYLFIYRLLNYNMYQIIELATKGAQNAQELPIWSFLLLLVTLVPIPAISALGYYLGTKDISIKEKIMYKKDKGNI